MAADMAKFDQINEVYVAWLEAENVPARLCVQSPLWDEAVQVEIMVMAAV